MLKLALVFPGQGAQYVGMGQELAAAYGAAGEIFTRADQICGYGLSNLCFEGPQEMLNQTRYAQPALLVTGLACLAAARANDLSAVCMSGLSLGEYTALVGAGALTLEKALPLVMRRAELMQDAVPLGQGAMAAIIGLDNATVEEVCRDQAGIVTVANYNCPGQLVISGEKAAVEAAAARLKEKGAKTMMLAVSVPSHSPLMKQCAEEFARVIARVEFSEPEIPVISNVTAAPCGAADIPGLLVQQLYSPVRWEQSVRGMMTMADYFVEVGPGSSLSGLIKKIDKSRVLGQVDDIRSLNKLVEKVKSI
ncbi:MAG: ACP S-malonyltransferase [Syntrophomonadaceae bacterium]